jgi:hypothetical protein
MCLGVGRYLIHSRHCYGTVLICVAQWLATLLVVPALQWDSLSRANDSLPTTATLGMVTILAK